MPTQSFNVTCLAKQLIAPGVYELKFTKPDAFQWKAGQFVMMDVPLVDNRANIQTRSYSVASTQNEKEILFVMKMKPGGRSSRWIEEVLEPGSEMVMKGPFGLFTIRESINNILMIATGTGIAPFRAHLIDLLKEKKETTKKIHLIFGVRNTSDMFWIDIFSQLEQEHSHFKFHVALSGEPDQHGHQGRVQTIIPQIISDFAKFDAYICGNPVMVKDLKAMCMTEWNMQKSQVHSESYI